MYWVSGEKHLQSVMAEAVELHVDSCTFSSLTSRLRANASSSVGYHSSISGEQSGRTASALRSQVIRTCLAGSCAESSLEVAC